MVLRDNPSSGLGLSTLSLVLLSLSLGIGLMSAAAGQSRPTNTQSPSSPVDQLMQEGQDLAAQGRFAEAEVPLKQAAELAPENYALLTLLGKIEDRVGKHADAIVLLRLQTPVTSRKH
jgi:tetratricopeptide (TPR) repeat protein